MGDEAIFKVTVLWAEELRAAGEAIDTFLLAIKEKKPDAEIADLSGQLLKSCRAALINVAGAKHIVVCEGRSGDFVPRITNVVKPEKVK